MGQNLLNMQSIIIALKSSSMLVKKNKKKKPTLSPTAYYFLSTYTHFKW